MAFPRKSATAARSAGTEGSKASHLGELPVAAEGDGMTAPLSAVYVEHDPIRYAWQIVNQRHPFPQRLGPTAPTSVTPVLRAHLEQYKREEWLLGQAKAQAPRSVEGATSPSQTEIAAPGASNAATADVAVSGFKPALEPKRREFRLWDEADLAILREEYPLCECLADLDELAVKLKHTRKALEHKATRMGLRAKVASP